MPSVEVVYGFFGICDVSHGFPRVIRFRIALLFDQILQGLLSSEALGSNNFFDFEFFLPFDQVWGWFRVVRAVDFVFFVGCEPTSIEDIVNVLPAVWQFQLEVDVSYSVSDFEWPKAFGSEFLRWVIGVYALPI